MNIKKEVKNDEGYKNIEITLELSELEDLEIKAQSGSPQAKKLLEIIKNL